MTIKYIITQINDNIIYSKYNNNGCLSLNIVDKSSLVGNIYIGRVENVVKNISSAFVEIENKIIRNDNPAWIIIDRKFLLSGTGCRRILCDLWDDGD